MSTKFLTIKIYSLKEELKKHSEVKESDLQYLREWCSKQAHLPKIEDKYLLLFLHSNYFSVEATKTTIENFFTIRTHIPEVFHNRDPLSLELRKTCKIFAYLPLNMRTPEGYQIIFERMLDPDPSHFEFDSTCKLFFMLTELAILEAGPVNGVLFVSDLSCLSFGHMGRINFTTMKKLLVYIQEAAPIRLKGIHFVNSLSIVETIVNMIKPFMKKELINMIHFHSSVETLKQYIPIEVLPNYMGGKAGTVEDLFNDQIKRLEDNRDWFLKEQVELRVDESQRIGSIKSNDLFGVEGNFKKLEID